MTHALEMFTKIRQRRTRRTQAAELLAAHKWPATGPAESLTWGMLLDLPKWCYWPPSHREHLVLVVGALFAAPAMRLWIEAKRIETARAVVGADAFDRVMAHELLPHAAPQLPADEDIRELLQAAGASVLLSSLPHDCLREGLAPLLPRPAGTLPHTVAAALTRDALALVVALEQPKQPPEADAAAQHESL